MERKDTLDVRDTNDLLSAFELADNIVQKNYISEIQKLDIEEPTKEFLKKKVGSGMRMFKIDKIIYDKNENNLQKLTNVYNMAHSQDLSIFLLLNSDGAEVQMYLGICEEDSPSRQKMGLETLYNGFMGNFPGSLDSFDKVKLEKEESEQVLQECFAQDRGAISVVSGVASVRNEKIQENEKFIQGVEKLVDAMKGNPFTTLIIANPISKDELIEMQNELEILYSTLKPFEKTVKTFSESQAHGVADSVSKGMSDTIGNSQSKSLSLGTTESTSKTKGVSIGGEVSLGKALEMGASIVAGPAFAKIAGSIAKTVSGSLGLNASVQKSTTHTIGTSTTNTTTDTTSKSQTKTTTNTSTVNDTDTTGSTLQIEYMSKKVKQLLDKIDLQLKRLKECESFGVFAVASYFLSRNTGYSSMAASTYKSLISGEKTSVESSGISSWQNEQDVKLLKEYLKRLYHPVFRLACGSNINDVTPVSIVSGNELAVQLGLPKKSVPGVAVTECAAFGRNLYMLSGNKDNKTIDIGNIYHMHADEDTKVKLKVRDLSMHTFITGATGSGKSNAVYTLLKRLDEEDISFLVVEPAKGEYKHIFGNRKDVSVYGTNPKKNKMLRINPFSFPEDIHVLEHIDKLIEIFNVCWPMYAAMPAVLKEAVEKSYIETGWDLDESVNTTGMNIYPTFTDVLQQLEEVIEASTFSEEVKSNYSGSLLTRVKSLTNGINGRVFTSDEIKPEKLFDENVIVDISRVGSMDTKSLIMGMLVLKMHEYRMAEGGMNQALKHVTVLEEAHNLLKENASSATASEGADLIGKSVEMLSNIIAEIRTYGEGFIIADQAPGLLDPSVIRNTNTKIILRLPDYEDRKLVGKAANLSDDQIDELAKLPVGVAAVYHNDWIEPVLCHFSKYEVKNIKDLYEDVQDILPRNNRTELVKYLVDYNAGRENADYNIEKVEHLLKTSNLTSSLKVKLIDKIQGRGELEEETVARCICDLFQSEGALVSASRAENIEEWNKLFVEHLDPELKLLDRIYQNAIVGAILEEKSEGNIEFQDLNLKWCNWIRHGGII